MIRYPEKATVRRLTGCSTVSRTMGKLVRLAFQGVPAYGLAELSNTRVGSDINASSPDGGLCQHNGNGQSELWHRSLCTDRAYELFVVPFNTDPGEVD
jgi:hypothetical protein